MTGILLGGLLGLTVVILGYLNFIAAKRKAARKVGRDGFNELMYGVIASNQTLVTELIAAGIFDVNAQDRDGMTALMYAAQYSDSTSPEIVEKLLMAGANPSLKNRKGKTAMHFVRWKTNAPDIQRLLSRALEK